MGLHTGEAEARDGGYQGYLTLSRTQRLMSAASGGQVLISSASEALLRDRLPAGVTLRDLGALQLKDFPRAENVYQLVSPDLPAQFPPLKSLSVVPNNLPVQLTSFIGREREVADVKRLLTTTRLLTLTGSGGTGKTRLSLAVAADLSDIYPDGVWLVELAPLVEPSLVPQTVAAALHVHEEPGRTILVTLTDYLRDKQLLLILDNCEHLIAACAEPCRCAAACRATHANPGEQSRGVGHRRRSYLSRAIATNPQPERRPYRSREVRFGAAVRRESGGCQKQFCHQRYKRSFGGSDLLPA